MFKLQGRNLYISRTQEGTVTVKSKKAIPATDIAELRIYEVEGLDEGYIKKVEGRIADDRLSVTFPFSATTTEIERANEPLTYWYDIRIGEKVIGYDENKARLLYIYPTGIDSQKQ